MKYTRLNNRLTTADGRFTIEKSYITGFYFIRDNEKREYIQNRDYGRRSFGWLKDAKKFVEAQY